MAAVERQFLDRLRGARRAWGETGPLWLGGRGQTAGVGSALSRWNAIVRSLDQGQPACIRSVAVRAWKQRRAATCSSR